MLIQILYGGHHISNSNHLFQSLLIDFGGEILSISFTRDSETFSVLIPCACPMHLAPSCGRILNLVWLLILAIYLDGPDTVSFVSKCGLMLKRGLSLTCRSRLTFYACSLICLPKVTLITTGSHRKPATGWGVRVWMSFSEHWKYPQDSKQIYTPGIPSDSWMDFLIECAMQLADPFPFNVLWESYLPLSQLPPAPQSCSTSLGTLNEVRDK